MVVPPSPLPGKYVTVYDIYLTRRLGPFSIPLKNFEIYAQIIAPKNFPRYIQCGISRAGERLFQESTGARISRRRLGDMHMPWRGCNHNRIVRFGGGRYTIDEHGADILDKIPTRWSQRKIVDAYNRKIISI